VVATTPVPTPERVRMHGPVLSQVFPVGYLPLLMLVSGLPLAHVVALLAIMAGLATVSWWHVRVVLEPDALVVRQLRRRSIPWASVQGIAAERHLGTWRVRVWLPEGRSIVLPAPSTFLLGRPRFERRFHVIGRWWLAHRGPDWTPAG
jgi:hypothetical protein